MNRPVFTTHWPSLRRVSGALLCASLLAACSGGGNGDATPDAAAAPRTTALISGKAVDGPLQGAIACYDLDDNGACASTEPTSAPTAADGSFALAVPLAEAGRHRVVVQVPASAIDADTGSAVGAAFVLRAPASGNTGDHSVFVSPLTTLVQAHMDNTGATRDVAAQLVQSQAGLGLSALADFTAAASGDAAVRRQAALVARLAQLTLLAQAAELGGLAGTPDRTGILMSGPDVEREVLRHMVASLPAVASALTDPAVAEASGSALQDTLRVLTRGLVARLGLTAEVVRAGATVVALAEPVPADPPEATGQLTALRYTDADNWFMRGLMSSAADNVPDAQGFTRYYDARWRSAGNNFSANGVVTGWSYNNSGPERAGDLHWTGSAWAACNLTDRYLSRVRDAQGRGEYVYCNNRESGSTVRRFVDISGRRMANLVIDSIRSFPGGSAGVSYTDWGPDDTDAYGDAVFPAGSYLIYQTNTVTQTAFIYDAQAGAQASVYNAAVSGGADTRIQTGHACTDANQTANTARVLVATLEELIARNHGTPCIYAQSGSTPNVTLNPNEWWGNSTLGLGTLAGITALPANTGTYYNTTASLRVAFSASGNGATFYRCYTRASDGSVRNCSRLGLGTWSVQTLGDARVLSFSTPPALARDLGYTTVLVERGGRVHFGYKNPAGNSNTDLRLNKTAANAVLEQLGLPRLQPVTQPGTATGVRAATLATLKGAWGDSTGAEATVFRFGDNGRFFMAEAKPFNAQQREQTGAEFGWFDHDPVTHQISSLLEQDSSLTSGTSHPLASEPGVTITAGAITADDNSFVLNRLPNNDTSLVGMWAAGSATDLKVPHFVFFANGQVMLVDPLGEPDSSCTGVNQCPPGVEYASYTYDPQTGALRLFNPLYDTNGCGGAFTNCPQAVQLGIVNTELNGTVLIQQGGQTAVLQTSDGATPLFRIRPQ